MKNINVKAAKMRNKQKSVERLNEMKSRFLEKVNKFDKLAELTQKSDTNYKYKK